MAGSCNTLNLSSISALCTAEAVKLAVDHIYKKKYGNHAETPAIKGHEVKFASERGDGYLGVIYRISVTFMEDNVEVIRLIGKGMPANIARRKTFGVPFFFDKEVTFYNDVIPVLREFEMKQRGHEAHEKDPFLAIPECYYAMADGENDFLLLEDLMVSGYCMSERSSGLNLTQFNSMMELLGRFHALSLSMKVVDPSAFTRITSNVIEPLLRAEEEERFGGYLANLTNIVFKAIQDDLKGTHYFEKYVHFMNNALYKNLVKIVESEDKFSVLSHGDAWLANFMFRSRDSRAKAIDFQLFRYNNPLIDLSMLVFACTTEKQRIEVGGVDGILELYHRSVERACQELGVKNAGGMTLEEVKVAWRKYGSVGLGTAIELVQLSIVEDDDVQDLDRMDGDAEVDLTEITQFKEVTSVEGKKRISDLIKLVVDEGII